MSPRLRKSALRYNRVFSGEHRHNSRYYHLSVKTYGRARGQSAVATSSYRSGERLFDIRSGTWKDCRNGRGGILAKFILGWTGSREGLWNAAEFAETRWNSRFAREVEIALPGGRSLEEWKALAEEFAKWYVDRFRSAVDVAIHESAQGCVNPHAHILTTVRVVRDGRFLEKIRELDARNTGPKAIRETRTQWALVLNTFLERCGLEKVSEKSLKAQGIKRQPTIHEGPRFSINYALNHEKNERIRQEEARRAAEKAKEAERQQKLRIRQEELERDADRETDMER